VARIVVGATVKRTGGFGGIFSKSLSAPQELAQTQEKTRAMRCTVHGKAASLRLQKEGSQAMIAISTCCSAFQNEVAQRVFHE